MGSELANSTGFGTANLPIIMKKPRHNGRAHQGFSSCAGKQRRRGRVARQSPTRRVPQNRLRRRLRLQLPRKSETRRGSGQNKCRNQHSGTCIEQRREHHRSGSYESCWIVIRNNFRAPRRVPNRNTRSPSRVNLCRQPSFDSFLQGLFTGCRNQTTAERNPSPSHGLGSLKG